MTTHDTSSQILFLSPLHVGTGNKTSIERIREHMPKNTCQLANTADFNDREQFLEFIKTHNIQAVVGLHAYRAGRLLTDCPVPYGIILGGTDVNEFWKDPDKLVVMTTAIKSARFLVAFCKPMYDQTLKLWPDVKDRLYQQHHGMGVELIPGGDSTCFTAVTDPSSFDFHDYLYKRCKIEHKSHIFLLIAGLRQVKDPLYIAQAFSEWHTKHNNAHLVILGPDLGSEFADKVKSTVSNLPGVHLVPALPQPDAHAAISQSFALINTSLSEGMSQAILEAMVLEVPVLARDIVGNTAIVKHDSNGLVFDTPQEFIKQAERLMASENLRKHLVKNAKEYVRLEHSIEKERETYTKLVSLLQS